MDLSIVILAAGQGTRMRSRLPKVLHQLAGRSLLEHVCQAAAGLVHRDIQVVYGHGGGQVPAVLAHLPVRWVEQVEQLGTGHAVLQALPGIPAGGSVLVLYGDVPLITAETLQRLVDASRASGIAVLTVELDDPSGYGRIVRDAAGRIRRIVEHKDADGPTLAIREVNTGMMAVRRDLLERWLDRLDNRNAQAEYYLTDVVGHAVDEEIPVASEMPQSRFEVMGVNDRIQLAELERVYQHLQARHLMAQGVTLMDPARFDLRGELSVGTDVQVDVNVVLEGRVSLADGVRIGPDCHLKDVELGEGVEVLAHSVIEGARIGAGSRIGPFARIRPETELAEQVHVGNFVELKKSRVGRRSKINHLSYVGDAEVGRDVNIGAGTIVCNYDGARKHRTVIGDEVFIGSDTQLVAPVSVGDRATIGAGTTLTRDAPAGELTLSRSEQRTLKGWQRPRKNH